MADPFTAVLLNLIASVIWSGTATGRDWYEDRERRQAISENLGDLPTEFNRALKTSIEEAAQEHDNQELAMVSVLWDEEVAESISTLDAYFGDEETAVQHITDAIESSANVDLQKTPRNELEAVIAEASREAIEEFEDHVKDADLGTELNQELLKAIQQNSDEALTRLKNLENRLRARYRKRYTLYDPETERQNAITDVVDTIRTKFADRKEVNQIGPDWSLVLGPSGSGKTRVIGEALRRLDANAVDHIFIPDDELLLPQEASFNPESFTGDVLLVWDDLQDVATEGDEKAVSKTIRELEGVLDEHGHDLYVLAAARSGNLDDLPGDVVSGEGIWGEFNTVWLENLPEDALEKIAKRLADPVGVSISDDALEKLVERAGGPGASSGPGYVEATLKTAGGALFEEDVRHLPDTAEKIWAKQYRKLKRGEIQHGREVWLILVSCKLLYEVRIPPVASLVRDVFRDILDAGDDRFAFQEAVELLREWEWINVPSDANEVTDSFVFDIHDLQLEAVDHSLTEELAKELSSYLLNSVELKDLPESTDVVSINGRFAVGIPARKELTAIKKDHFEETITLAEDDESSSTLHHAYGFWLEDCGDRQPAVKHYALALQHNYQYPQAHNNYALLLAERGDRQPAAKHYALALQHGYEDPQPHHNYAGLLEDRGDRQPAVKHYALALQHNYEYPQAHNNYALLLESRGGLQPAAKHYALALQHNYEYPQAHHNYAGLLAECGDRQPAAKHYALALQHNYENPRVHNNYALLLIDRGNRQSAAKHYALALQYSYEDPQPHHNYGVVLKKRGDVEQAAKHFEHAIRRGREHGNLGIILRTIPRLVRALYEAGQDEKAIDWIEKGHDGADLVGMDSSTEYRKNLEDLHSQITGNNTS